MVRLGLIVAGLVLLLDQATKWWILRVVMDPPRLIEVTGFFNLVLVWNRGISFGLLGDGGASQAWILAAFGTLVAGGLVLWLHHAALPRWPSLGVGLLVGGALGNVIDRLRFGAVVDFLDLHAGGWHWPAFNVADSAITVGVAILVIDAVLRDGRETA
jgi:signal peptidase II